MTCRVSLGSIVHQFNSLQVIDMRITSINILALAFCFSLYPLVSSASDQGIQIKTVDGSYEEVFQTLQDAVIDRGLVIDYVGHVDKMLERTAAVAGKEGTPYLHARYFQFCSAPLTHEAVSADVSNLAVCPLIVFAFETKAAPGKISVGFRELGMSTSSGSRADTAKLNSLLQSVIDAAVSAK